MSDLLRGMLVIACILSLVPVAASAQGTITGLSASPSNPAVDEDTVITVQGTGFCQKLEVDFGDGQIENIKDVDFDNNANASTMPHPYSPADDYTVTATPLQQCNGQATLDLVVGGTNGGGTGGGEDGGGPAGGLPGQVGDVLCVILNNCPPDAAGKPIGPGLWPPHIDGMFTLSVVEPGGAVIVYGQRFGNIQGELHMVLKDARRDVKLEVIEWDSGHVGATIPINTIGVVDQKAEFYVKKRSDGTESKRYGDASFRARRSLKMLPRSDVSVFECSFDSNCDECLTTVDMNDDCSHQFLRKTGTITAYHKRDIATVGNAEGPDIYKLNTPLTNGWKLDNVTMDRWYEPGEKGASVSFTSSQIRVDWWLTPHDSLWYDVYVIITGPIGTSHN